MSEYMDSGKYTWDETGGGSAYTPPADSAFDGVIYNPSSADVGYSVADLPVKGLDTVRYEEGAGIQGLLAPYDTRTCAERHGADMAEMAEHVHGLTVLTDERLSRLEEKVSELSRALLRLSEQVLEMAQRMDQWTGEL